MSGIPISHHLLLTPPCRYDQTCLAAAAGLSATACALILRICCTLTLAHTTGLSFVRCVATSAQAEAPGQELQVSAPGGRLAVGAVCARAVIHVFFRHGHLLPIVLELQHVPWGHLRAKFPGLLLLQLFGKLQRALALVVGEVDAARVAHALPRHRCPKYAAVGAARRPQRLQLSLRIAACHASAAWLALATSTFTCFLIDAEADWLPAEVLRSAQSDLCTGSTPSSQTSP